MPMKRIVLDYANVLSNAVGAAHGLGVPEIQREAEGAGELVRRIEAERKDGKHRYRDLPTDAGLLKRVNAAVKRFAGKFDNLVVLGIGGSALGNIALQSALNPPYYNQLHPRRRRGPRLFVLDNVDPVQIATLLDLLGPELKKTLFNVISKSGETAETAAQFLIIRDLLAKKLGKSGLTKNLLVTTDPRAGTMRSIVDAAGWDSLHVPDGVGGRFSVLSAVGLFSAGMCGISVKNLLAGAADMSRRAAEPGLHENPAAMLATLLHALYTRGKRLHVMMPYSYQLKDLADWYCQLWAESLGKCQDSRGRPLVVGPTPIRALGATDQHSQVQLYREGPNDKVFIFLEVDKFASDVKIPRVSGTPEELRYLEGSTIRTLLNSEKRATEFALVSSNRPCLTIRFPRVDEFAIGQFIMLWEAATSIAGYRFDINPYDQPAVQMGKDYTYALMGRKGFDAQRKTLAEFAARRGKFEI